MKHKIKLSKLAFVLFFTFAFYSCNSPKTYHKWENSQLVIFDSTWKKKGVTYNIRQEWNAKGEMTVNNFSMSVKKVGHHSNEDMKKYLEKNKQP